MMRILSTCLVFGCVLLASVFAAEAAVTAESALEQLKSMAGTWSGPMEGEGAEAAAEAAAEAEAVGGPAVHEFAVSAGGTVVMETMAPGTPHEMINMYHLDGDDLVLTHYCSGGNQPVMRLDREASSPSRLVFAYAGGTNHDPAVDQHIHSAELEVTDGDHVVSRWMAHDGGRAAGAMNFRLTRYE